MVENKRRKKIKRGALRDVLFFLQPHQREESESEEAPDSAKDRKKERKTHPLQRRSPCRCRQRPLSIEDFLVRRRRWRKQAEERRISLSLEF